MKKLLLFLMVFLLPKVASADDSGSCGDGLTYSYVEATQIMTISKTGEGTGAMSNFKFLSDKRLWNSYATEILQIIIEDGVTSIGDFAFYGCSGLISVNIPESVTSIGENAFERCSGLSSVTIPNSVKSIGKSAFSGCSALTSVKIPANVTTISIYTFSFCVGLTSVSIPNSVTTISDGAFYECTGLSSIIIPEGVTSIGNNTFYKCSGLTSVNIPRGVTTIGDNAFSWCTGLSSVTIPNNVTSIGESAFSNCYGITSLSLPINLTIIKKGTFQYCSSLTSLNIPASVQYIYQNAFDGCSSLEVINALPTTPPFIYNNTFSDYSVPLIVPSGCVNAYKDADYWKDFSKITDGTKYKLTYIVDGEEYKTFEIEAGIAITPESEPTKEGYTFSGWSSIPETMPAIDVTVTGTFTKGTYELTYLVDGAVYKTVTYDYGTSITPEAAPTKEGYTFSGWSTIPETMPAKDVTITGTFTINKYKLTYMVDGAEYKSTEIEYGAMITLETAPTKEGYSFSGWSNIPETMPANDVTITGTFTKGSYKITYMVDGAEYKTVSYDYGATITPETEPTKEGYTFSGWSTVPETMPAKDVTVTGTYNINKYKLVYMVDGVEYKSYDVDYGATITPEAAPIKEGYTFSGWSGIPTTMLAKDITITGTFTINKYKLTYMVDGNEYKTIEIEYGTTITPEVAPTKEGFAFSGWSSIPETMPAKDVTVTGTFTKGAYKLTYMVDGAVYKTVTYDYETSITPETAPTKEGYTFSGWANIPATMPANDVTVTGTFTINKYKLVYMVDGVEYKSYDIEYGATITPEAEPTKEGHSFSGWCSIPATMPANDVTVTGTFNKRAYKLTYMVDGEEYKTVSYDYDSNITPEAAPAKEGYTFSGWSEIPETMPAQDVTVSGTFTINKYKLSYMVDGAVYKTVTYDYGTSITPEAEPTKEGYTFSGWSEVPATMPAKDVIVIGTFTINKYKLTYMVDGSEYKTIEIEYGTTITPEVAPTKEGFAFSGWSEIPTTMPAKDITVTGSFTINKYKLVYMVDGAEYKSSEVEYGAKITPEAEPTKEGYTFSGWSTIPETMPAKDVTITGTFTKGAYKLTYIVDGAVYKTVTYDYGATIIPEAAPTKEGYTFSGWSEVPATMPAKDVTVTGTFTINKYKLTYMVDGVEYKSYQIEYGSKITPEAEPTKEGYTFSGWSTIPETMPAKDVTITGTFTKGAYKLTYMVDGAVYKTVTYDYGTSITPEVAPTKEGYTFSGWSEVPATMPAKDVTVIGTFTINKYKLTYILDGAEYKSSEIEYGAKITPEAEPTKEGYTFSGWSNIPETMPANDVTVTGTFTKGAYKLTYMVDGVAYKTVTYDYETSITPESAPTKEGYTFSGWSEVPATMPAKDVTVNGTFTINKYKLVYMVDGVEYKSSEIEYGATITPEAEPTKEGHSFSGWSEIPSTMPAHDVEITGTFTQVMYEIDDVTYEITGEGTVTIKGSDQKGEVTISATIEINGQTYQVTAIAENAYKDNQSITSVTIPEGISTIGANAFNGCIGLIVINIGKDVQSIGNKAFANIGTASVRTRSEESMLIVNCYTESVPYTALDAFENMPIETGTLYVVDNLKDSYKATSPWSGFGKIIGFEESVGINAITIDSGNAFIFDMQGNRLDSVHKGVNIIRYMDGKTKKVVVK